MNTHIDQLAEWWENAEESDDFYPGDTWIKRTQAQTGGYVYDVGRVTSKKRYYGARVLARAPKPKPAWHDAVAVIAHTDEGHVRQIWERDGDTPFWCGTEGYLVPADTLRDVTPLIEAKVTDEMIVRAANAWTGNGYQATRDLSRDLREDITHALTAALGLEAA